jgi:transcription antitermination factor NusG
LRWYAVHTRSNFEKRVAADFAAKGLENYLPAVREVHLWKDRKKAVEIPVFPGYVFVRVGNTDRERLQVLHTLGTVRILGNGGEIEPIPDLEIESLQQLMRSNTPVFAHPFLREGSWVRVKRGALEGLEGFLVRIKTRGRLVLSVNLLSRSVATEVDLTAVEAIRPAAVAYQ